MNGRRIDNMKSIAELNSKLKKYKMAIYWRVNNNSEADIMTANDPYRAKIQKIYGSINQRKCISWLALNTTDLTTLTVYKNNNE